MKTIDDETKREADKLGELIEKNYPAKRREEIRRLHLDSFQWRGNRIPLAIEVTDPENGFSQYPGIDDPLPFFKMKIKNLAQTVSLNSDFWPLVGLDYFGNSVLPSMLGCEIRIPSDTAVVDNHVVGPWIIPILKDIEQVWDLKMPDMSMGLMPQALEAAAFFRKNLPESAALITILKLEPFTFAGLLRGSDIFLDLYEHPDEVRRLLEFCTELFIRAETELMKVSGEQMEERISLRGFCSPGIRLNGDTIISLSPQLLEEFIKKPWDRIAEGLGGPVLTHYCSTLASKGFHLFPLAANWDNTIGLSTQLGYSYYEEHYEELSGKLAVESGYAGANAPDIFTPPEEFETWAKAFSLKDRPNGLLLSTTSDSLEKGRKIMEIYKRCFLN